MLKALLSYLKVVTLGSHIVQALLDGTTASTTAAAQTIVATFREAELEETVAIERLRRLAAVVEQVLKESS